MAAPTYRTHPVHTVPDLTIEEGYAALAEAIRRRASSTGGRALIVVDGFAGVRWQALVDALRPALQAAGLDADWLPTQECFLSPQAIDDLLAPTLTSDPVFGRLWLGHLEELWDAQAMNACRQRVADRGGPLVVYGCGASLLGQADVLVYVDLPKDRGQALAAAGEVTNLGGSEARVFAAMYKRLYFVDWPALNRIKRAALPLLDFFVDLSELETPRFVAGDSFRAALRELSQAPVRAKPWFAPGPWGGQWMKEEFGLPPEAPNYAWSFELIAPENGILLGDGRRAVECSLDCLLWQEGDAVLGESVKARYGSYFPIRLDYLDTMSGGNLSCQVHPRMDYMHTEFGEPITQDETYYIVTCKPGARVFLGLREDAEPDEFQQAALKARDHGTPFDIEQFVNSYPSQPHDLFMIPSGTVHCSGADNVVLEISSTPYIFTLKIYDYLRTDLQGHLRQVYPERAFANIDCARTGPWVEQHLLARPVVTRQGEDWVEYCLGDNPKLFFGIHRLEFTRWIEDGTGGKFVVLNLVEGERCEILTAGGATAEMRFGESLIVPAAVGTYRLRNLGGVPCKAVKAFVKG